MQYHLDGFRTGDPSILPAAADIHDDEPPAEVDVLIVGCGPAGLTLAAQLAAFGDITTRIIDQKPGPLLVGQADGIACRSMEMFEAFGFCDRVLKEAYWVNETVFWRPDPGDRTTIARADRIQDVEDGLSEMPHTILSQARIHDFYLDTMLRSPRRLTPDYGRRFVDHDVEGGGAVSHPVTVTLERLDVGHEGETETVRARYLVGCDGARSAVRTSMGIALRGDAANKIWGVADLLAVTDFPDIRLKAAIQSADDGSMLIIPREGGYMVRIYTELGELEPGERAADRSVTPDDIIEATRRVLHPYKLEVKEVGWWSAYEIGQRLSDTFDNRQPGEAASGTQRVFITGDACHTHSPKAGQGMNVAMADSFNLGWKLAAVIQGRAAATLLDTYSSERQAVAKELIDFDREMETLLGARAKTAEGSAERDSAQAKFQEYFERNARYTAGVETRYSPSIITTAATHQDLAAGFVVGMRFHSEAVVRLSDAKPVQLGHTVKADGRWRLFAFADAGDPTAASSRVTALCEWLERDMESPVVRYTSAGDDVDSAIDVHAVFQQYHRDLSVEKMPSLLLPRKGPLGLIDYQKIYCPDLAKDIDIFDTRGIDRAAGCIVVVRPDQYVATVLPLDGYAGLVTFLDGFMRVRA